MIEEVIKYNSGQGIIKVQRLCINCTSMGLYEGLSNENLELNLEFQGHPFGNPRIPIIYIGKEDYKILADTYCVWMLLESEPIDEKFMSSALAVCLITDRWDEAVKQINQILPKVGYWNNCRDFDL